VLYLYVLLHLHADSATGPVLISLHVNKMNGIELYYQYIQELIISLNSFYHNNHSITNAIFRCDFLLSLLYVFLFVVC
jgi:hypothetical protein